MTKYHTIELDRPKLLVKHSTPQKAVPTKTHPLSLSNPYSTTVFPSLRPSTPSSNPHFHPTSKSIN